MNFLFLYFAIGLLIYANFIRRYYSSEAIKASMDAVMKQTRSGPTKFHFLVSLLCVVFWPMVLILFLFL